MVTEYDHDPDACQLCLAGEPLQHNPEPLSAKGGEHMKCNTLFCILDKHEGDQHCDATGHSWSEPLSEHEVIAKVYDWPDA